MSKREELVNWLETEIKESAKWEYENFTLTHRDTGIKISNWDRDIGAIKISLSPSDMEREKSVSVLYSAGFNYHRVMALITQVERRQDEEVAGTILKATEIKF